MTMHWICENCGNEPAKVSSEMRCGVCNQLVSYVPREHASAPGPIAPAPVTDAELAEIERAEHITSYLPPSRALEVMKRLAAAYRALESTVREQEHRLTAASLHLECEPDVIVGCAETRMRELTRASKQLEYERKRGDYLEHERGEWSAFSFKQAHECIGYIEQIGDLDDARAHDDAIIMHNRAIRAARWRRTREDLRLTAGALQRELERVTALQDDLERARAVALQAEAVRDEADRLRRDLAREREAHAATREELTALHDVLSGARRLTVAEGKVDK